MSQRNRPSYLYIYSLIVVWLTTSLLSNFLFCFYFSSLSPQAWAPLCATQHEHTASLLEASVDIVAKNMVLISLFWVKLDPWVFYSLMWHHIHRDTGYRDVLALSLCCLATFWRLVTKELSRIDITWNSFLSENPDQGSVVSTLSAEPPSSSPWWRLQDGPKCLA